MKYFTLLTVLFLFISCSKENIIDKQVNIISKKTNQKTISESVTKYIGVFGHNTNKELHGKITVNEVSKGMYEAEVTLVNGDTYHFTSANSPQSITLSFKGKEGSFSFNINDPSHPIVSNVFINSKTPGYIKIVPNNKNISQVVVLGTYEETGNEADFYGNWDLIGTATGNLTMNSTNLTPPEMPYFVSQLIVSHKNNPSPFEDLIIEEYQNSYTCSDFNTPTIETGEPGHLYLVAFEQSSLLAGHIANWELSVNYDNYNLIRYISPTCENTTSGTWSWNGKNGIIYCDGPPF